MYSVEFSKEALKQLKKLDRHVASLIIGWIKKNLEGSANPRTFGKALTSNHSDKWRYRVGDYRILANIQDENIIILVINIGHRKDIYK